MRMASAIRRRSFYAMKFLKMGAPRLAVFARGGCVRVTEVCVLSRATFLCIPHGLRPYYGAGDLHFHHLQLFSSASLQLCEAVPVKRNDKTVARKGDSIGGASTRPFRKPRGAGTPRAS